MAVYLIQARDGSVKIGKADDPEKRLRDLQTAHAYELSMIRVLDGGFQEEWEFQYRFRINRIRGEWFTFHPDMLTFQPSGSSKVAILRRHRSAVKNGEPTSAVEFVRDSIRSGALKQREVARLMGMSSSRLSRKLAQYPDDSRRFTLDDFETYVQATGDTSPILYLVEKFLAKPDVEELEEKIRELQARLSACR
tara:strand:- start:44 stop:625 length:582 start_codon:yes stop_codon:yes gene_type:complete